MPLIKGNKGDYLKITGRAGMDYTDESGKNYFIDSEMVVSNEYDIAVYIDSVTDDQENLVKDQVIKDKIIERIKTLSRDGGIKIRLFHDS